MAYILDKIIQNKTQELRNRKAEIPISELIERINGMPVPRPFSPFVIGSGSVAVVAEIKRSSPSAGVLRRDFDAPAIARSYEGSGASAISVLTDERFFGGSLRHLSRVRSSVQLPLLRKDFIIDPYQVVEARVHGADAILLIVSLLSETQYAELLAAANEFNLETLVEVHTAAELEKALKLNVKLVGINNRNLHTFSIDLTTTETLLPLMPNDVGVVSESGIKSRGDVAPMAKLGVDAVLVGETLMKQRDIGPFLAGLVGVQKWSR